jgi:hypothetical protein
MAAFKLNLGMRYLWATQVEALYGNANANAGRFLAKDDALFYFV